MINLLLIIPVSTADSGHKSLISKTKGTFKNLESIIAEMPINNGGEVTKMISGLFFNLNKPA